MNLYQVTFLSIRVVVLYRRYIRPEDKGVESFIGLTIKVNYGAIVVDFMAVAENLWDFSRAG